MSNKTIFAVKTKSKDKTNKQLRKEGFLPANIYGADMESTSIECSLNAFKALHQKLGETGLVYLKLDDDKKEIPAMLDEIQINAVSDLPIHVTFQKVNLNEKVESEIPIEFIGEVEIKETVVVHVRDEVTVEALPTDLPEKIVVDVSVLEEVGQSITLADLNYDKSKVTLVVGEEGEEAPVVLLQEVKEEIVEEEPAEEAELGEDGEAVVEGESSEEATESSEEKTEETPKKE